MKKEKSRSSSLKDRKYGYEDYYIEPFRNYYVIKNNKGEIISSADSLREAEEDIEEYRSEDRNNHTYLIIVKKYWDKYKKRAFINNELNDLEEAKRIKRSLENADGISYVIIDKSTWKEVR